jgi:integrase/recombinase XerD
MNIYFYSKEHKNETRLFAEAPASQELITIFRSIEGRLFSATHKMWHFPDNENSKAALKNKLDKKYDLIWETNKVNLIHSKHQVVINKTQISPYTEEYSNAILLFKKWMQQKRYSENTVEVYTDCLHVFFNWVQQPILEIDNSHVFLFNDQYILKKQLSVTYQSQFVNALKLFYSRLFDRKLIIERIDRPKKPKTLPNVLSKEEIKLILEGIINNKHRAMLSLIYACGLRCGELLSLKPEHIDSNRNLIIIKQAKGNKDRVAPLSTKLIELLRTYYKQYQPKNYLFEGQESGEAYTARSLQQVLKQAVAKARIKKPVTLHWLRHSFATHLLENGTDLRYIQEILGHSRSTTTEIYTHVSNKSIQKIVSPFDYL